MDNAKYVVSHHGQAVAAVDRYSTAAELVQDLAADYPNDRIVARLHGFVVIDSLVEGLADKRR